MNLFVLEKAKRNQIRPVKDTNDLAQHEKENKRAEFENLVSEQRVFFRNRIKKYKRRFECTRLIVWSISFILEVFEVFTLIGATSVAIWIPSYSAQIIPALGISGTVLMLSRNIVARFGCSERMKKYKRLKLKAIDCEETIVNFQLRSIKDKQISDDELLDMKRLSMKLQHEIKRLKAHCDDEIDRARENSPVQTYTKSQAVNTDQSESSIKTNENISHNSAFNS